jgi:hypothetical protein
MSSLRRKYHEGDQQQQQQQQHQQQGAADIREEILEITKGKRSYRLCRY